MVLAAGIRAFRTSVTGEPRGPVCNMACCQECFVTVDGRARVLACMTPVADSMTVTTDGPNREE